MLYLRLLLVSALCLAIVLSNPGNNRILNGYDASPNQFPHQISLRHNHTHICGGSIISSKYILTAAHCVVDENKKTYPADRFTIRAGTINRIAGGIIVPVKRVKAHPDYAVYNDLALLELKGELVFSSKINSIELFGEEVPANSDIIISGWGLTEHAGATIPIYLQYRNVTAISKVSCAKKIGQYTDALLCLEHEKNAGACNGDSGGPATYNGKLVGVAGFVVIKCGSTRPDGYAKVAYNIDWITKNMI